jgi:predicted nucleic acid-binding protein
MAVIDTNVLVSACLGSGPANEVVRACLQGRCRPVIGAALLSEYEDVFGRDGWARKSALSVDERGELLDIFLAACSWTRVYYGWRPNLPDEADNHLIELAIASGAHFIVSRNLKDITRGELRFAQFKVCDPLSFLKELESWPP